MSSFKHYLRSVLSPRAVERLNILSDSYKALRRTFAPRLRYPISTQKLRESLQQQGVKAGDHLVIHSSLTKLSTRSSPDPQETSGNQFQYAAGLIEMLIQLVGPAGSIWMPTDAGIGYDNAMRGIVFDYQRAPSGNGLVTEIFRRRKDVVRDTFPFQNLTGWGPLAQQLISYHESHPTPYPMDTTSPWHRLQQHDAKVLFLGAGYESNSSLHIVEYAHHAEYPTPIYFNKPFRMRFRDRKGIIQDQEVYIHPFFRKPGAASRFCHYLQQKYSLYKEWNVDGANLTLVSLSAQTNAIYQEMQDGVTLYDPRFW